MGVTGLWDLLYPVKKKIRLSECQGKKLAVDLSSWIIQCSTVFTKSTISKDYLGYRNIFFRTLNLLSIGVSLVFVLDGPAPPKVKKRRKRRDEFYKLALQYKVLLSAMGIPVVECVGEAEKMCAQLDCKNFVDGVLTEDGDVLIYGAQTVYKGLSTEKKIHQAEQYIMSDITSQLGLNKRDLVAFALINKGDFCDGVPKVAEKGFTKLFNELKSNDVTDILDRLINWRSNSDLDDLKNTQHNLSLMNMEKHCTRCLHEGTKLAHSSSGCSTCSTSSDCINAKELLTNQQTPCLCQYHCMMERTKSYSMELKTRELALYETVGFPNLDVVSEFLDEPHPVAEDLCTSLKLPNFERVCEILQQNIRFSPAVTMSYLMPACIKMSMHGLLPELTVDPSRIIKSYRNNGEQCYMVKWNKVELEDLSDDVNTTYDLTIPVDIFAKLYPEMSNEFQSKKASPNAKTVPRGKTKIKNDPNQQKMTQYFKVQKMSSPQSEKNITL